MALLKETITVVLESARRVCTSEAHEEVKKELYRCFFNASCIKLLEKWFSDCFNKLFGVDRHMEWNDDVAVGEIKVVFKPFCLIDV